MRILTAQEFCKEPYGTVYVQYKPHIFIGQPEIKSEPRGEKFGKSWWATDILPWAKGDSDSEAEKEFDKWDKDHRYEIETEGFCTDDATYNHDEDIMYAVFNKDEVKGMINRLIESLYESEQYNK